MKYLLSIVALSLTISCIGQTFQYTTSKFGGTYGYGKNIGKGTGEILIYPESDSTILFFLSVNRGAPSYNMGTLYGRIKVKGDIGACYIKFEGSGSGCRLHFQFSKNCLKLKIVENEYDCGFGHAVFADGDYRRKSKKIPEYFEQEENERCFFRTTNPDDYYKY
jgi:hypothetical protein